MEIEFELPRGYVDAEGMVHSQGRMRLATALDEIEPLSDPSQRPSAGETTSPATPLPSTLIPCRQWTGVLRNCAGANVLRDLPATHASGVRARQ